MLAPYLKSITAFFMGFIPWLTLVDASPTSGVTSAEWIALVVVVATAAGVYTVPNKAS